MHFLPKLVAHLLPKLREVLMEDFDIHDLRIYRRPNKDKYSSSPELARTHEALDAVRRAKVRPACAVPSDEVFNFSPACVSRSKFNYPVVLPGSRFLHWISRSFFPRAFVREFVFDAISRFDVYLHKPLYAFPGLSSAVRDRIAFDFLALLIISLIERCSLDRNLRLSPRDIVFASMSPLISFNPVFAKSFLDSFSDSSGWFFTPFYPGCSLSQRVRSFASSFIHDASARSDFIRVFLNASYLVIRSLPEIDAVLEQLHRPVNHSLL